MPKFVYLDMEEYRDLAVTAKVFMRTLDRKGLERASAGIALQAYLPDSFPMQKTINAWARRRVAAGGAPVTLRIVKGANLEMERIESSLRGWPQAPFRTKVEVDANYKRMLHEAMRPENLAAVRVGLGSHNLFELAYGLVLARESGALGRVQFEMLEGMANHQRRALFELSKNLLLYAAATRKQDFIHAIGYLVRRLDENTGEGNFLRHAFRLNVDSDDWHVLEAQFAASFALLDGLAEGAGQNLTKIQSPGGTLNEATVKAATHSSLRSLTVENFGQADDAIAILSESDDFTISGIDAICSGGTVVNECVYLRSDLPITNTIRDTTIVVDGDVSFWTNE